MPRGALTDILAHDLRILLVAINPAPPSLASGYHFATPTNGFWKLMFESGLTPRLYRPFEASCLLSDGIGLTSLVSRATRTAAELTLGERREGVVALAKTVERWKPRTIALLGLTLFPVLFPDAEDPGPGLKKVAFGNASVFVLPNPSGRNRAYPGVRGKLPWYQNLAKTFPRES
ncbi:mismatch-specific DNA-glycosylase [Pendulispora rubella]|uniref:Mismatch-specific DNA-glycosylase n=1 Tax=Pendulispora rubella TaxID=2741070 RepID=A0ABZ2L5N0_9BACT